MGELPAGWLKIEIGGVASIIAGGTPKASDETNFEEPQQGIAWLTPADLSGYKHKYISNGKRDLSQKGLNSSSAKLMPEGSVLFSSRAPIGYVAIAKNEIATNQGFKNFVFTNDVDSSYAYYYLKSIKSLAESKGTGTTFKELSGAVAKKLPFILSPLNEQIRIANKLDSLLAKVEAAQTRLDKIPTLLKRFRQSVLAAATSGELTKEWRENNLKINKIDPEDYFDTKLGYIETKELYFEAPNNWGWVRFGSQVKLINGDRGKNYPNKSEYVENGVPFINTGHITPNGTLSKKRMNYISREKFDSLGGGKIQLNDLVYCLRGATMGKTASVTSFSEGAIASSLVIVRPTSSLIKEFAHFFLISPQGKNLILKFDNGSAQPNLSAKSLAMYPLALPSIEEQKQIVQQVEVLFALADKVEKQYQQARLRTDKLTQSLLAKAFKGELVPQDPNDEPAKKLLARIQAEREKLKPAKKPRKSL